MRHAALLAALVLLGAVVTGSAAATAGEPTAPSPAVDAAPAPTDGRPALAVGAPRTNFTVSLRANGDARWTVETRIPLGDEADRDAFREYAAAYEAGDADGGPAVGPFRNAAAAASNATGREMSVVRVNRSATLHNESGVLRLRFTWSNFLAPGEDGALVLGDALRTPDNGTWFGSLSASQRLVIEPPADYEVSDVSQGFSYSISNRRIVAEGPQTFDSGDIEVRYEPGAAPPPGNQGLPMELVVGGGAVLLFVVAALAYRRGGLRSGEPVATEPNAADSTAGRTGASPDHHGGENGSTAAAAADASTDGTDGGADGGGAADDPATAAVGAADVDGADDVEEDLELLSDEERVERLLERNGGRMRQANIVSETGWSDAKVSQLLSAMADEGRVEKLRLGRENLISLADGADDGDGTGGDGVGGPGGGETPGVDPDDGAGT
ncbi:helix-turn-helix transcriptional regulator [Halobaculum sp. EA56]|uniref:helix-turn-helix transcriptional regulator n=1 Tax=Halobaculum sp. EA56 TaxID=3421648 RepID=UPI003EBEA260